MMYEGGGRCSKDDVVTKYAVLTAAAQVKRYKEKVCDLEQRISVLLSLDSFLINLCSH